MTHMTVHAKYVNGPKPGKKMGSINDGEKYYNYDPTKFTFNKGVKYLVDVQVGEWQGKPSYLIKEILQNPVETAAGIPVGTAGGGGAGTASTMSKSDWEAKDQFIARQAIAKSCIEANVGTDVADVWMAWVNKTLPPMATEAGETEPWERT